MCKLFIELCMGEKSWKKKKIMEKISVKTKCAAVWDQGSQSDPVTCGFFGSAFVFESIQKKSETIPPWMDPSFIW